MYRGMSEIGNPVREEQRFFRVGLLCSRLLGRVAALFFVSVNQVLVRLWARVIGLTRMGW